VAHVNTEYLVRYQDSERRRANHFAKEEFVQTGAWLRHSIQPGVLQSRARPIAAIALSARTPYQAFLEGLLLRLDREAA